MHDFGIDRAGRGGIKGPGLSAVDRGVVAQVFLTKSIKESGDPLRSAAGFVAGAHNRCLLCEPTGCHLASLES